MEDAQTHEISGGIGMVGAGRLGSSLALALERAGHPVTAVASASDSSARALSQRLSGATCESPQAVVARCELVLLAVPDDQLAAVAAALPWARGQQVVHCSGALGLAALEPAQAAGALRGCLHPLQTFPERFADPARFSGIVCGVEADGALGARLEAYVRALGASVLRLEGVDRARYHAAAVFASNYVVALHAAAAEAFALAGLPAALARTALAPLTQGALDGLQRLTLENALTGPIARGDLSTIERHLSALAATPELCGLYRRLGAVLLALPLALSADRKAALQGLLSSRG